MGRQHIGRLLGCAGIAAGLISAVYAHEHSRPDLNGWFQSLRSDLGPCCANADGNILTDNEWESVNGHYRVFINDRWIDVPDGAVIKSPNLYGRTMVWPYYTSNLGEKVEVRIRCFMIGPLG
jgi:hypothetical protein